MVCAKVMEYFMFDILLYFIFRSQSILLGVFKRLHAAVDTLVCEPTDTGLTDWDDSIHLSYKLHVHSINLIVTVAWTHTMTSMITVHLLQFVLTETGYYFKIPMKSHFKMCSKLLIESMAATDWQVTFCMIEWQLGTKENRCYEECSKTGQSYREPNSH